MFFNLTWDIWFYTETKKFQLRTIKECEVTCSVDNLADTAIITLPEAVLNSVLKVYKNIPRGTRVVIKYGYDDNNVVEFEGYVKDITTNENSLKINCEDGLFLFRKQVPDIQMKPTSLKKIAQYLVNEIDPTYKVVCKDYDLAYEKFVIHQATGYDVLKKIQEETKANIYFNTVKKELHIHPPYFEKGGEVKFSPQRNIRTSSLVYKKAIDRKFEITVERTGIDGKVESVKRGTTGGDSLTIKAGAISKEAINKIADAELLKRSADGYEGSFDSWLIPFVAPTYTANYNDSDYPEQKGNYYVVSVKTNISASGGKRTVQLGIKLGNG
jgi:hypothetical protein